MKILLAEDDLLFQIMLQRTLQKWGYDVTLVSDGEQAWQHLNSPTGPRLALLDWVMPGADGLDVCRRVREARLPHYVYLILLTGKTDSQDLIGGLKAGADDYLVKPISLDELRLRVRAGCRVLESEEQHRIIAETASDGIVTVDYDGHVYFANSAAGQVFGMSAAEVVSRDFSSLVPDFDRHLGIACKRPPLAEQAEQVRSWPPIELVGRHRSAAAITLEIAFSESRDTNDRPRLTAMIRDVTQRRLQEGQQARAQKLESIGHLAAGVAHEINTPIQYIGDNLRFLEDSYPTLDRALAGYRETFRPGAEEDGGATVEMQASELEYLRGEIPSAIRQALEGVGRVGEIVKSMKEFAHPGSAEMAPVDLNRMVTSTAVVSRNEWKYAAELETDLDPDLPLVNCVSGELSQVVLNLIVNAVDAIKEANEHRAGEMGHITIRTCKLGDLAEIRVEDSGGGIPPDVRPKIFDPFFTTKDVGQGSGQGLAIAHAIVVQRHRGTIEFETTMGLGTQFIVRLPIHGPRQNELTSAAGGQSANSFVGAPEAAR